MKNQMGTLKDRLLCFIAYLNIDKASFEKKCSLSNGFVDKCGNNTRTSSIDKISKAYPVLNISWLRNGVGDMLDSTINEIESSSNSNDEITRLTKENADLKVQINHLLKIVEEAQAITKDLSSSNERLLKIIDEYGSK